ACFSFARTEASGVLKLASALSQPELAPASTCRSRSSRAFPTGASSLTKSESKLSHSKCCSAETARKRAFALQMLLGGNRPKASFRTPNAARRKPPESKLSHSKCCPAETARKQAFALQMLPGACSRKSKLSHSKCCPAERQRKQALHSKSPSRKASADSHTLPFTRTLQLLFSFPRVQPIFRANVPGRSSHSLQQNQVPAERDAECNGDASRHRCLVAQSPG